MTRLLVWPMIAATVVFYGALVIMRAVPRDDNGLRAFFAAPDGCALPCWAGIRPGETRLDEAIAILQMHPWVGHMTMQGELVSGKTSAVLWWHWNGRQPAFIDGQIDGRMTADYEVIRMVTISTTIPMGDARAILGEPARGRLEQDPFEPARASHLALYGEIGVETWLSCPLRVADLWRQPVQLDLASTDWSQRFGLYALADWLDEPPC